MMEKGNLKVLLYFLKYSVYTTVNIDTSEFQISSWSIYSKSYVLYYAISFHVSWIFTLSVVYTEINL